MPNIEEVKIDFPEGCNVILGYSHFIKTVEDLYEIIVTTRPDAKFAIAFSEASSERLIRYDGNSKELIDIAVGNMKKLSAGHTFLIILENVFPISILNQIKACQEIGRIFAATANPLYALVYRNKQGGGIVGVIDGMSPLGVEDNTAKENRKDLLRKIGYKK
ncbi:MAG: adenosine-specific kinase [Candidatus Thermoplasmatota archaeon]|jgi:adenosine/AMP kinase|nr:adenosine-specific kinase [Candidatus Thermoplasmatota archaeon]MCL5988236.1 adenosine-specific kinase [Candidatus Thermoplasmatota archaeon]